MYILCLYKQTLLIQVVLLTNLLVVESLPIFFVPRALQPTVPLHFLPTLLDFLLMLFPFPLSPQVLFKQVIKWYHSQIAAKYHTVYPSHYVLSAILLSAATRSG